MENILALPVDQKNHFSKKFTFFQKEKSKDNFRSA